LHWKKLAVPVVAAPPPGMAVTGFRDPCPWREPDGWYLAVGSGVKGEGGCVLLYRSADLRHWEYLHPLVSGKPNGRTSGGPVETGEMWECPDFFAIDGKHCLLYSTAGSVTWSTGEYDDRDHRFTPTRTGVVDHGAYYAPKSFLAPGGRRILWGWITETRPEEEFSAAGWAGATSLPRELRIGAQGQLEMHPAREADTLAESTDHGYVKENEPFRRDLSSLRQALRLPVPLFAGPVGVRLLTDGSPAWELTIDPSANQIRCGGISFPLPGLPWPRPELRLFLDGSVIETFIGGREALTSRVYTLIPGKTALEVTCTAKSRMAITLTALKAISSDRLTT